MVKNGFKRKNALMHKTKGVDPAIEVNGELDCSYVFSNSDLIKITRTTSISNFCKIHHLKYIAHVTRLENSSIQKQLLFRTDCKKYTRDRWKKYEAQTGMATMQLQREMQDKNKFISLMYQILGR